MTASAHSTMTPKADPPTRTIMLLGREVRLKSDEDVERLHALAATVDATVAAVAQGKGQVDQQILLVSMLRLADEVHKLRDERRELTAVLKTSTRALLGRIPA